MHNVRHFLRQATADQHALVDEAFAAFDLSDPASYGAFLAAHARVLPEAEDIIAKAALWQEWTPRARLLLEDLKALGQPCGQPLAPLRVEDPASQWGMLYVLEGSRLGGSLLAKQVPAEFPSSYLSAGHAHGSWQAFQAALEEAAASQGELWLERAAQGARSTFDVFQAAAEHELRLLQKVA